MSQKRTLCYLSMVHLETLPGSFDGTPGTAGFLCRVETNICQMLV